MGSQPTSEDHPALGAHLGGADARTGHAPGRAAWNAVISLSLGVFGLASAEFLPAALLPPIASGLHVSVGTAGQAVTTTAVAAAIAGPLLVMATTRTDRRLLILSLSVLLVLSDLLAAAAPSLWVLLAARIGLGIALGGMGSFVAALCLRLVSASLMSRALAIVFTGMTAASVLAPAFGAYVGGVWGWRAAFLGAAVIGVAALLAQLAFLPRMRPNTSQTPASFVSLLRRPPIRIGLAAAVLVIAGHFAGFTYVRPFLQQVSHLDLGMISSALLLLGIGGFIGNIAGGFTSGRNARVSAGSAAIVLAAGTLVLLVWGASPVVALAAAVVWGVGFGAFPISLQTWAVQTAPDEAESIGALMMSILQVAIAVGAVTGGVLVDHIGARGVIGFCGVVALVGGIVMLTLVRSPDAGRRSAAADTGADAIVLRS